MTTWHTDDEFEAGVAVQVAKEQLLMRLPEEERKTVRRWGTTPATTFEDRAIARLAAGADERLKRALYRFQAAVNSFWVLVIERGYPRQMARDWWRKNKGQTSFLTLDEVEAEVLMLLRQQIILFQPKKGGRSLKNYSYSNVMKALDDWRRGVQAPAQAGRDALRVGEVTRVPLDDEEDRD